MTQTVLRLCGIALLGLFSAMLLKERYKIAGTAVVLAAFLIISAFSMEESVGKAVETVSTYISATDFSEYAVTLLKALGIAYITGTTETVCREAGEATLAGAVEFAGKAQLILLSLPLISSLLDIAAKLL